MHAIHTCMFIRHGDPASSLYEQTHFVTPVQNNVQLLENMVFEGKNNKLIEQGQLQYHHA
eukprot:9123744-Heterocapsa_arctica.AAC.1